jgi:hypothetical protein
MPAIRVSNCIRVLMTSNEEWVALCSGKGLADIELMIQGLV